MTLTEAKPSQESLPIGRRTARLGTVDLLRCIAGTGVLWHHMTLDSRLPTLRDTGRYGWTGVEIFFVVSGFVIPYAMHGAGYRVAKDIKTFLLRRLIRLDPPYFAASAGAVLLWYLAWLTPGFGGPAPPVDWATSLAHIGYLNGFLGLPWYLPVSWTLGIEFQFYLIAAIAFPALVARTSAFLPLAVLVNAITLLGVHFGFVSAARAGAPAILSWVPLFVMGIAAFRRFAGMASNREFLFSLVTSAAVGFLAGRWAGIVAAVPSAVLLAYGSITLPRLLQSYAGITYSLYLVHDPVGMRAVHLVQRLGQSPGVEMLAALGGVMASLAAAVVFWHYVERPALRWAAAVKTSSR